MLSNCFLVIGAAVDPESITGYAGREAGIHLVWYTALSHLHLEAIYHKHSTYWHVFGKWEETSEPRGNAHRQNKQNSTETETQLEDQSWDVRGIRLKQ